MKKSIVFLLTFTMILSMTTFAKTGDVIGKIYSTDIKAYINGVQMESYNIGGKTVVVLEDITNQCEYSDELRTLLLWELSPNTLIPGTKTYDRAPGTPVGNIYQTDIKTIVRGKEIPCWSLNGKMAVALEDLGANGEWSDIGGKFIWNADERTISLEFMYGYSFEVHKLLRDKHLNMILKDTDGVLEAELVVAPLMNGQILNDIVIPDNSINPLMYGDEIIGYKCKFPIVNFVVDEKGKYSLEVQEWQLPVDYLYVDKFAEIVKDIEPAQPTYEDRMNYFEFNMYKIISEFETDEYHFLYMLQPNTHGSSQFLKKVNKKDGTLVDYSAQFKSVSLHGNKYFDNVTIDEENKKVRFGYDAWYIIDLETDKVEKE